MSGVLEGFAVLAAVIAVGYVLAARNVLTADGAKALSDTVFHAAMPCLLFGLVARESLSAVFSPALLVAFGSVVIAAGLFVCYARWARLPLGETVIGALTSCYVNAGNLGVPIAVFVLGSGAAIAPILMMQLIVLAPLAFALLDRAKGRSAGWRSRLAVPLRNPITPATAAGLLVSAAHVHVPEVVMKPVDMIGGLAVPGALLAYGVSLRLGPAPLRGTKLGPVAAGTVLKVVVQPLAAFALGSALGLSGTGLLATVVVASLPTAQNVFVYASAYDTGTVLARDVVFLTTLLALPSLLVITALLS